MWKASSLEVRSIISGFKWTYASVALQGILKLVALMVLARLLTPRDFGLLGFSLLCTNIVERIGQGGIGPAIVQAESPSRDIISTAWWMSVLLGVLSMVVVSAAAGQVAVFFGEPELVGIVSALSIGCLLEGVVAIPEALLQRDLRFKAIMFADNLAYFVAMVGVCIVLALNGWGVWSLVVAQLVLKSVKLIVVMMVAPRCRGGQVSWTHVRYLAHMGFGFSLGRLLNFCSLQGDNFIVGRLLGTEALGIYNRAYQLMTLPAMYVGQVFERVMFPAMARRQSDRRQLGAEFLIALEVITLVALPAGIVMFILAREIVMVGFGERWQGVAPVFSVLSFGVFFRTAYKCSDTVVRSLGAVFHYAARQALYALLVLGGAWGGAMLNGVPGVAWGVVGAVGLNYLSMTRLSVRILGISVRRVIWAHLVGLWSSAVVALVLTAVTEPLRAHSAHSALVLIEAATIAAGAWALSLITAALVVPFGCMPIIRAYVVTVLQSPTRQRQQS